ncbi:macrophage-expressed gene 1 protein-like [Molossus molossus]|uniref:macrophage-expressed gene 1 protein-like n=1 Tax=Molossus molossus TaxID=27622 RepID=UPI00174624A9|nr:macrophage-expressed gene 1 protein-like [Molossus molossus]
MEELRGSRLPRRHSPALALCRASLLVLLFAGRSSMGDQGVPGIQGCKQAPQTVSVLGALPGGGWDNLRNVELGLVLMRNYSQCRTTEDGEYLIPDQVHVVPQRESVVETRAELIDEWLSYTDTWAASINTELSFLPSLNGKFSVDFQNVKKYNLEYETVTTRVQVRYNIYSVKVPEAPDFHPAFLQHLLTLSDHLENNQTQEAEYLAEMLVLRYGTHVLTHVEAGATLVQEDQVKRELVGRQAGERSNITLAASAMFYHVVNVGASASWQEQNQLIQDYVQNLVASKTRSHGGAPFYPGITLQKWQEGIGNRLVAIGRSGLPLPALLEPEALPELPAPAVRRVAATVRRAIHRYYAVNAHPGCVRLGAPAFNPQANVDDGSCDGGPQANFSFGGVFQECKAVSGKDADGLCQAYRVPNPLTGNASCPANYKASVLHSELKTSSKTRSECQQQCQRCWLFFQCCQPQCAIREQRSVVRLDASWCVPTQSSLPAAAGFLFGGLYSPDHPNPLTRGQTCPPYFYPLALFGDLRVCVSSDLELCTAQAVPFGGFFSCQMGNPLAGLMKGQSPGLLQEMFYQDSPTAHPMKCPAGYSQHQAYLSEGCQILYCLRAGALLDQEQAAVRMPPFLPRPPLINNSYLSYRVDASGQHVWVRPKGSDHWQQANINDQSLPVNPLNQAGSGPSLGAIVGTCVGTTVALVAVALGVSYGFRYYKKGGYQKMQGGILTQEQSTYGATEPDAEHVSVCTGNPENSV